MDKNIDVVIERARRNKNISKQKNYLFSPILEAPVYGYGLRCTVVGAGGRITKKRFVIRFGEIIHNRFGRFIVVEIFHADMSLVSNLRSFSPWYGSF